MPFTSTDRFDIYDISGEAPRMVRRGVRWPRADGEEIVGLKPHIQYLHRQPRDPEPTFDRATERLDPTETADFENKVVRLGWRILPATPPA